MTQKTKIITIIIILTIVGSGFFWLSSHKPSLVDSINNGCFTSEETKTVKGNSLSGFLENGTEVKVINNFYKCTDNEVKRDDVILFSYSGNKDPLIKIVKAVPGDKFALFHVGNGWNISINDEMLTNSKGDLYLINRERYEMLALYEKDYHGVIPPNSYLILGNLTEGSTDSTQFGLVDKGSLIAKAIVE